MVKESIADLGLTPYAVYGLLTFFGVYAAIAVWTMTRLYKQVAGWASLPLNDDGQIASELDSAEFSEELDDDFEETFEAREGVSHENGERSGYNAKNFVSIN